MLRLSFVAFFLLAISFSNDAARAATPSTQPAPPKEEQSTLLAREFADQASKAQTETQALEEQVNALRAENIRLKAEIELLRKTQQVEAFRMPNFSLTPSVPANPITPHGRSFQYNGQTVYLEPLAGVGNVVPNGMPATRGNFTVSPYRTPRGDLIDNRPTTAK